ncbi:hypothetical protein C5C18_11815 [Rathayibacter tritici]|uniref:hypothetical protein n=1 Tax=Rathayibacter tritici TaxID=33888 RepID=UPI000CE84E30|nr:hypothetical protein [Rathayibacter tritici]PPF28035.1 hypothetical protein C5C06_08530 [Rathayibacter tritici]PPF66170.1 hypothetical protein C5C21_09785 [Rathayibacter tritici]PPG05966.1 hypothetical protein C5C18_11815 [Rathayibacter tritici]PPI10678.1 hypothetical protein C5D07_14900 [Rathayibacter tritici]PPI47050.1 hypothetical protein C5D18_04705 [Rathayibacter tritici]
MDLNHDGVDDALDSTLRSTIAIATQLGHTLSRALERGGYDQVNAARTDRAEALAALIPVKDKQWWDHAGPADIGRVQEAAIAWAGTEPAAAIAASTIREQVLNRYGIDTTAPAADAAYVAGEVARIQAERAADVERDRGRDHLADSDRHDRVADALDNDAADLRAGDTTDGQETAAAADRVQDGAESHRAAADGAYDAAEQHTAWAATMQGKVPDEAIESAAVVAQSYHHPVTRVGRRTTTTAPAATGYAPAQEITQHATHTRHH